LAKPHGPENTLYTLVKQSIQSEADIGVKKHDITDSDYRFLDEVFNTLSRERALIVLSQKGQIDELSVPQIIEERLEKRFGSKNTYFLMPLSGASVKSKDYFADFGQQLDLADTINNHIDLERALKRRLQHGKPLFLFIRVVKGDGARTNELAGMLRNLLETTKLQVLLLGDQELVELRYGKSRLSLLDGITVKQWPELSVQDVRQLYPALDTNNAQAFLEMSGGLPKLLAQCWEYFNKRLPISDYPKRLQKSASLVEAFMQFTDKSAAERQQICHWLAQEDLGPTETYIRDDLLRQLYWSNLLAERNERLVWRCEVIRKAGQEILACFKK
jgi:hypothetical protein